MITRVLDHLPPRLRGTAVTLYGARLARRRYKWPFELYLAQLMESQRLDAIGFQTLQDKNLREVLREAIQDVPYYRDTIGWVGADLEDFTVGDLIELPILEKDVLRDETRRLINNERVSLYGSVTSSTSGTTGSPLKIPYDWDSMRRSLAMRERFYRWHGVTRSDVSARFSGRPVAAGRDKPPFWFQNRAENQWFFSTYHLREDNASQYVGALNEIRPLYLDGYPSALRLLAQWVTSGAAHIPEITFHPIVVITTGETLSMEARDEIESAFGCPVANYYSSSEGAPYITDVPAESGMLVNPESGIVEFLDQEERKTGVATATAEMVVTSFIQRSVPLIRYRIGDSAVLDNQRIGIGRAMPRVAAIRGRQEDIVVGGDGRHIGMASYRFFKHFRCVREAQIVQHPDLSLTFNIVASEDFDSVDAPKFERLVVDIFGPNTRYQVAKVAMIPRGSNGKFRTTIRETA